MDEREHSQSSHVERFLGAVLDALPVALFCKDVSDDYRFYAWNRTAEDWFGLSRQQVLGHNDYDFFPKEQADFFRSVDEETVRSGKRVEIAEEPLDTPNGRRILHTLKVPLQLEPGEPGYLLGISWDITEAREKARELERQRSMQIAQARLASLGVMAGGIAHEINNPLAVIQGVASQLRRSALDAPPDAETVVRIAQKIEKTVERIGKIVRGLRSLARVAESDPKQLVILGSVVEETVALCRTRFHEAGIALDLEGDFTHPIECRPGEIAQVLINLLNNAFDAVATHTNPWVRLSCAREGAHAVIAVTDSGPGIGAEVAERIMEPFFTTKDVGHGTGLGLSISRAIIEEHRGTLSLDRAAANTRFLLRLPAADAAASAPVGGEAVSEKAILIVDDEADIRELLAWEFRRRGWAVHEAAQSGEAWQALHRLRIDVVVTDLRMPGGSGLDLLRMIRGRDPKRPSVVLMTGYSEVMTPEALVGLSVAACFAKPFDPEALALAAEQSLIG